MTRSTSTVTRGNYTLKRGGQLILTGSSLKFTSYLDRDDAVPGIRDGDWIHPTDYWSTRIDEIYPVGIWERQNGSSTDVYDGHLASKAQASTDSPAYSCPDFKTHVLNQAIISCRGKLLGDDAFNAAQNIVERQQAIDLIGDRMRSVYRSYKHLRKGRFKQAFRELGLHNQRVAQRLSENILAWNFGAAPLFDDIKSAVNQFNDDTGPERFVRVRGSSREGNKSRPQIFIQDSFGTLTRQIEYWEERYAECVLWVKPDNLDDIRRASLSLNNPILLGYEVIPYSFLLDYAWNLGGWLNALGATSGWSFYSGYTMERTECVGVYLPYKGKNGKTTSLFGQRNCKQFRRRRLTSFPVPGLPGFKNPFTLKHTLNILALFGARL